MMVECRPYDLCTSFSLVVLVLDPDPAQFCPSPVTPVLSLVQIDAQMMDSGVLAVMCSVIRCMGCSTEQPNL